MIDFTKQILTGQFEAALSMLRQCVEACPEEEWERPIVAFTVRQLAYHTLFFVDFYLSAGEDAFELREPFARGGDERAPVICAGLSRAETLEYLDACHRKLLETVAAETEESLRAPSGFAGRDFTRGELHLYNLRHVQHHAGQMSSHLRRVVEACRDRGALPWVSTGWKAATRRT